MSRQLLLLLDKTLFRLIFYFVVLWAKPRYRAGVQEPAELPANARFLVIRPGGLGDALMCVPMLRALREAFPKGHITVVCVEKNRAALELLSWHDELVAIDVPRLLFQNALRLRRRRFDAVFDVEPFRRLSSIVAYWTGAPLRVGFDTGARRALYTHLVSYAHDRRFEGQNMTRQLAVLGVDVPSEKAGDLGFDLSADILDRAAERLQERGVELGRDYLVAVACGVLKPHHRWVMSEFAGLIDRIRDEDPAVKVVLVGGPADRPDTDEVVSNLDSRDRLIDLVGEVAFAEALGVLAACRVLVASDGGVVYMAACVGCATVSLWGPGVMERFKPPGDLHAGVRKQYACIPCVTWSRLGEFPRCPYGRRCYNDLTADEVFAGYARLKASARPGAGLVRSIDGSS